MKSADMLKIYRLAEQKLWDSQDQLDVIRILKQQKAKVIVRNPPDHDLEDFLTTILNGMFCTIISSVWAMLDERGRKHNLRAIVQYAIENGSDPYWTLADADIKKYCRFNETDDGYANMVRNNWIAHIGDRTVEATSPIWGLYGIGPLNPPSIDAIQLILDEIERMLLKFKAQFDTSGIIICRNRSISDGWRSFRSFIKDSDFGFAERDY